MKYSQKRVTQFRHMAKITLAYLETQITDPDEQQTLMAEVDNYTWQAYDVHKADFHQAIKEKNSKSVRAAVKVLKSDLMFLFLIRCKKYLLGIDAEVAPLAYVLKQADKILKKETDYNDLIDLLKSKLEFIHENGYLPFDYQYIAEIKILHIPISPDQCKTLFKENELLLKHRVIPEPLLQDNRFFTHASKENLHEKQQHALSKPRPWAHSSKWTSLNM